MIILFWLSQTQKEIISICVVEKRKNNRNVVRNYHLLLNK